MEQLTMLDAGFLQAEDSDRHVSLAIGAIAVLSGPMPDFDSLAAVLAERILSVPRFRQVLRTAAANRARPIDKGEGERATPSRKHLRFGRECDPVPVHRLDGSGVDSAAQRGVVTLATNVPGPRKRLRVMKREVIRLLPIPPLALQLRTGIAIMSYADHLVFGIIGDYDATPDVDELANGIERAVVRLSAISAGHWRSTPVGTLSLVHGG
jgi:diacylglycerol O-acyltransferase